MTRRRRLDLVDVLRANVAAAGSCAGDLVEELEVACGRDDIERLDQAIINNQLSDPSETREELSGL